MSSLTFLLGIDVWDKSWVLELIMNAKHSTVQYHLHTIYTDNIHMKFIPG
jgi:hypothetical protein